VCSPPPHYHHHTHTHTHNHEQRQSEHVALESQYQKEVLALDRKYAELYETLYSKRESVVGGTYEPTEEECDWEESDDEEEEEEKIEEIAEEGAEAAEGDVKGIPRFWLTVLGNCRQVRWSLWCHPGVCL